jgi:hypothetical protein
MKYRNFIIPIIIGVLLNFIFNGCSKDDDQSIKEVEKPTINLNGDWESQEIGKFEIRDNKLLSVSLDYHGLFCGWGGTSGHYSSFSDNEIIDKKINNANSTSSNDKLVFSCDFTKYPDVKGIAILGYRCWDCTTWCEKTVNFTARKSLE